MIKMEKKLTEHDKFYGGDAQEIRARLIEQKQAAGGKGTPYCVGFNPAPHSSGFILFWLPGTKTVQEEKIKVTLAGYKFRDQTFASPSRLINWFKGHAMDLFQQQTQLRPSMPPPASYKMQGPPQGRDPGGGVQWGMGSSQAPRNAPPGGPPAAAAGSWNGPPGGDGGWGSGGGGGGGGPPYQGPGGGFRGSGPYNTGGIPPPPNQAPHPEFGWGR